MRSEIQGVVGWIGKKEISNWTGEAKDYSCHPRYFDFLDPSAPNYRLKKFESDLYFEVLSSVLISVSPGARILDAGSGCGRIAFELIKRGFKVTLVDKSLRSLNMARRRLTNGGTGSFEMFASDIRNMSFIKDSSFDLALAIEVLCYLENPLKALREISGKVRHGGWVAISVEGNPGGILANPRIGRKGIPKTLSSGEFHEKGYLFVKYYTKDETRDLMEASGLKDIQVAGTHYFVEGPLGEPLRYDLFDKPSYRACLLRAEKNAREDPFLERFARSWVGIGKVI